jgi:hypothetical protein
MEHVLNTIAARISPAAVAAGASPELRVGKDVFAVASELFEAYGSVEENESKMDLLRKKAEYLTIGQFDDAVKAAQSIADNSDKSNGFTFDPNTAKGNDKKGPARRQFDSRTSEMRQIFGVLKQAPDVLKGKGYHSSLTTAREWLKKAQVRWDGVSISARTQEENRKQQMRDQARILARKDHPQEEGESDLDYDRRIATKLEGYVDNLRADQHESRVDAIMKGLLKQFKDEPAELEEACRKLIELADKARAEQPKQQPEEQGQNT